LFAIDPTEVLSELHRTQWTTRDGSPGTVNNLAQTKDGYLWLGTDSGLFRFDGAHFELFKRPDNGNAVHEPVTSLYVSPSGDLWIGLRFGGVLRYGAGNFIAYGESSGLPMHSIMGIALRDDGSTWAATTVGLYRLSADHWQALGDSWGHPASYVDSLYSDQDGTLWSRGPQGTFFLLHKATSFVRSSAPPGRGRIRQGPDGSVWVADYDLGLLALNRGSLSVTGKELGGNTLAVGGFVLDRDGGVWTQTYSENAATLIRIPAGTRFLSQVNNAKISEIQKLDIRSAGVQDMLEDREGTVWLATDDGLERFRSNKFHSAAADIPLEQPAIATDASGSVFVLNGERGLLFRPDGQKPIPIALPSRIVSVSSLTITPDGSVWMGAEDGTLFRLNRGTYKRVDQPPNTKRLGLQSLLAEQNGTLWVSVVGEGLYRLNGDHWDLNGGIQGLPKEVPVSIYSDGARLWFGFADNQVAILEKDQVTHIGASEGLNAGPVLAVYARGGHTWIAGIANVFLYLNGHCWKLRAADGGGFTNVSGIVEDSVGGLWINSASGVIHIFPEELAAFIRDQTTLVAGETLTHEDGLQGITNNIRPLPTALEGGDGRIWITTREGAYWIDPKHIHRNPIPPPVFVTGLKVNEKSYPLTDNGVLPVHTTNFEVDYTALSLAVPSRVRFKYRLEGVDGSWQQANNRREAFYTNIAPGAHTFHVVAANEDGIWNEDGATLIVKIPPAFYQTVWFYILCAIASLGMLWGLYRMRLRQITRQVKVQLGVRLSERERIARDLHDTLLQGTQGLILLFQGFAGRLPNPDPMRRDMELALDHADALLNEARNSVSELRNTGLDIDIAVAVTRAGDELFADTSAQFSIAVSGTPVLIVPAVADDVFRIVREALTNAARHSEASRVDVKFDYGTAALRLWVRDDGMGLSPEVQKADGKPNHFGLKGMRERAQRIGASFDLVTHEGGGVEIHLAVPAARAYQHNTRLIGGTLGKIWRGL
jgi:signal transduction histidine kinase/ligand-binding sensor domain-containing protein